MENYVYCPKCGSRVSTEENYCPECGARMHGDSDSNNTVSFPEDPGTLICRTAGRSRFESGQRKSFRCPLFVYAVYSFSLRSMSSITSSGTPSPKLSAPRIGM
jgi:hypothetical protein